MGSYRLFENDTRLGKVECAKQKSKRKNKFTLIAPNKSTRKRKRKKAIERDDEIDDEAKKPKRKRIKRQKKVKKIKKEKTFNPKTHILTRKGVLIPIQSLRRSARLASK